MSDAGGGCVEFSGEVHPFCAMLPMLPDDEMEYFVASIKARGLIEPIVLDASGVLIDGKIRLEACQRAGVPPRFTTLPEGSDPESYIMSVNLMRKSNSPSQGRMLTRIFPLPGTEPDEQVALLLEEFPTLAATVRSGALTINEAHKRALTLKQDAEEHRVRYGRLRMEAPDIAELVENGERTLADAEAEHEQRQQEERQRTTAERKRTAALNKTMSELDLHQAAAVLQQRFNSSELAEIVRILHWTPTDAPE